MYNYYLQVEPDAKKKGTEAIAPPMRQLKFTDEQQPGILPKITGYS